MKNRIKIFALMLLIFFVMPCLLYSENEFQKWRKTEKQSFSDYKKSIDEEFVDYLKKDWKEFKLENRLSAYKKPKPVNIPKAPAKKLPEKIIKTRPGYLATKRSEPVLTAPQKVDEKQKIRKHKKCTKAGLNFLFCGTDIFLCYDPEIKNIKIQEIDNHAIASFWTMISKTDYNDLIAQTKKYKKDLKLNDWGYNLFVYEIGKKIFREHENLSRLFLWFIATKSNLAIRIGYNNNRVYPLFAYNGTIYGSRFFNLQGQRFYVLSFGKEQDSESIKTYKRDYSETSNKINLQISASPVFATDFKTRELSFRYQNNEYKFKLGYNKNLVNYFKNYPQTELQIYFNANITSAMYSNLLAPVRKLIENEDRTEAVKILLRLTQTVFDYKTDGDQFGYEKYMLPHETLYYPFSDCEDRSIFFAFLVKNLLSLDVVGLHYPGHLATAVRFNKEVNGTFITYKGKKYVVCDPTYINANPGMVMPKFRHIRPEIIKIGA